MYLRTRTILPSKQLIRSTHKSLLLTITSLSSIIYKFVSITFVLDLLTSLLGKINTNTL